jgi:ribose transport system substrate-binding protein
MVYLAIMTLVANIKGEKVERRIDTGVAVATKDNMDQPGMKELVHPDLAK